MHVHFYRTDFVLSEYNFTLNFCRVVIEKVGFKVRLRYGTHTVRIRCGNKFAETAVKSRLVYIFQISKKVMSQYNDKTLKLKFKN